MRLPVPEVLACVALLCSVVSAEKTDTTTSLKKFVTDVKNKDISDRDKFSIILKEWNWRYEEHHGWVSEILYTLDKEMFYREFGRKLAEEKNRKLRIRIGTSILTVREWLVAEEDEKTGKLRKACLNRYADFLKRAVLHGGEKEMMTCIQPDDVSAVGELALIMTGFWGRNVAAGNIDMFRFPEAVPVMLKCMWAPDKVYPVSEGCIFYGEKAGKPSGRNVPRQRIPYAIQAILGRYELEEKTLAEMERVVTNHKDVYLRTAALKVWIDNVNNTHRQTKMYDSIRFASGRERPTRDRAGRR